MPTVAASTKRVFVVDDDTEMCRIVHKVLAREGYCVESTADPQQALSAISQTHYDLVITDMRMGATDGRSILRTCLTQHPPTKVVIMTAYGDCDEYQSLMDAGAFDYLPKPLAMSELQRVVGNALSDC